VRPAVDSRRHDRPLFLFDLAVPRDIDPSVSSIDGVHLYNIDDLSSIAEQNLEQRKRAAAAAERIIEGELDRFTAWWDSLDAAPIVRSMWQQAEEIRRRELDRALDRMKDLPPEQVEIVEALTRSIVKKLLHDPTSFLKERADRSQLESAEAMFKLWKDQ
jgi:glutamyl-tRNA reductase